MSTAQKQDVGQGGGANSKELASSLGLSVVSGGKVGLPWKPLSGSVARTHVLVMHGVQIFIL